MNEQHGHWRNGIAAAFVVLALFAVACRPKPMEEPQAEATPDAKLPATVASGKAPNFTLTDLNGKPVSLSDYSGKAVILDFWATWCPPCVKGVPEFVELYEAHKEKGLVVLGVALDDAPELVKEFAAEKKVPYPILHGDAQSLSQVVQAYGSFQYIPTTFLIAPDGEIVQRFEGYHEKQEFENLIPRILPGN